MSTAKPRGDLFSPQCSTRDLLDRIGDRWTSMAVKVLARRVAATVPPSVRFRLTSLGLSIDQPLAALREWEANMSEIDDHGHSWDDARPGRTVAEEHRGAARP